MGKDKSVAGSGSADGGGVDEHGQSNGQDHGRVDKSCQGWGRDAQGEVSLLDLILLLLISCSCRDIFILKFSVSFGKIIRFLVMLRALGCIGAHPLLYFLLSRIPYPQSLFVVSSQDLTQREVSSSEIP